MFVKSEFVTANQGSLDCYVMLQLVKKIVMDMEFVIQDHVYVKKITKVEPVILENLVIASMEENAFKDYVNAVIHILVKNVKIHPVLMNVVMLVISFINL